MSWYQENKFAGTLLGVTAVVSGALIYLGMSANSGADAAMLKEQAAVTKINTLQAAKPYPSDENEKLLAEALATFATDTKKFQDKMLAFRPEEMQKISSNEFNDEVSKYVNKLNKYYKDKDIKFPGKDNKPYYGMEAYAGTMADEKATMHLNYHRQGLEWLFTKLADAGIDSLDHVYRAPAAEELGKGVKAVATPAKKAKKSKSKKTAQPTGLTSVSDRLPIEITFRGTEASLQEFLKEVAAGEEYFFAVKLLKISNEEQDPVIISQATFAPDAPEAPEAEAPVEGGGLDLNEGFDFTGGGEFPAEEDKEIIKQVIGDEKITVFVQLDLILMKDAASVQIPRLKKDAPVTASPKKPETK